MCTHWKCCSKACAIWLGTPKISFTFVIFDSLACLYKINISSYSPSSPFSFVFVLNILLIIVYLEDTTGGKRFGFGSLLLFLNSIPVLVTDIIKVE